MVCFTKYNEKKKTTHTHQSIPVRYMSASTTSPIPRTCAEMQRGSRNCPAAPDLPSPCLSPSKTTSFYCTEVPIEVLIPNSIVPDVESKAGIDTRHTSCCFEPTPRVLYSRLRTSQGLGRKTTLYKRLSSRFEWRLEVVETPMPIYLSLTSAATCGENTKRTTTFPLRTM